MAEETRKQRSLVLLSGGMDSSVLLANTIQEGGEVLALTISYGQRHSKELLAAKAIASHYGLRPGKEHFRIDLPENLLSNPLSSQTGLVDVPEGHYAAENMKSTVVPNRNMVFLSIAVARGIALSCDKVVYAAHAGDHDIYPDCRADFVHAMRHAVSLCDWNPPELFAPFLDASKADIVKAGLALNVPFEKTWTCYKGETLACGKCGTCVERLEAFFLVGGIDTPDPIPYADRDSWREVKKA